MTEELDEKVAMPSKISGPKLKQSVLETKVDSHKTASNVKTFTYLETSNANVGEYRTSEYPPTRVMSPPLSSNSQS